MHEMVCCSARNYVLQVWQWCVAGKVIVQLQSMGMKIVCCRARQFSQESRGFLIKVLDYVENTTNDANILKLESQKSSYDTKEFFS